MLGIKPRFLNMLCKCYITNYQFILLIEYQIAWAGFELLCGSGDLQLVTLLPPFPECWDYRLAPLSLGLSGMEMNPGLHTAYLCFALPVKLQPSNSQRSLFCLIILFLLLCMLVVLLLVRD